MEDIEDKGISISLRTPTFDDEKHAKFCCAAHAAAALTKLAEDRHETLAATPRRWKSV
jgi:hypothetical protein